MDSSTNPPTAAANEPPLASVEGTADDEVGSAEARVTEAAQKLADVTAYLAEVTREHALAQHEHDQALIRRDSLAPRVNAGAENFAQYLAGQQAIRDARGEQIQRIKDSGIDLSLLIPQKPPVDRPRPRGRPPAAK